LIENIKNLKARSANFVIIIPGAICDQENTKILCLEKISPKLGDDQVIIGQGSAITFESPSSENSSYPAISTIAGEIVLGFIKRNQKISSQVASHLTQALASKHKQTRILAAKAILFASENNLMDFSLSILTKLEDLIADDIPDVAIYMIRVFTKIYRIMSQESILVCSDHMDMLTEIYTNPELRLNNEDFCAQIKENILTILTNQSNKQKFAESIFGIFEQIFILDEPYKKKALDIIGNYTGNSNTIPESTVLAIESVLRKSEFPIQVLDILEKIAENGQVTSDKILDILARNLYLNDEEKEVKDRSFQVLEIAERNQDLSDEIFEIIEVARAGFVLESNATNFEGALEFLEIQTKAGRKLPSHVFQALDQKPYDSRILSILLNVSTNGQILPKFIINKMKNTFTSEKNQDELVKIFFNLTKNNQHFPLDLLDQLEKRLDKTKNEDETLLIFAYRAQRGETLSQNLIKRIADKFLTTTDQSMKHEALLAFCSIIKTQKDLSQELQNLIEKILISGFCDENEHTVLTSLKGIESLCAMGCPSQGIIEALIQKVLLSTCPQDLKQKINSLLDSQSLNQKQATNLKLAQLNSKEEFKFLMSLAKFVKNGKLLEQHFQQIEDLINESDVDLQEAVINMLALHPKKSEIPDYLIDRIATVMFSTSSIELKDQCLSLIGDIAKSHRIISQKALFCLCTSEFE